MLNTYVIVIQFQIKSEDSGFAPSEEVLWQLPIWKHFPDQSGQIKVQTSLQKAVINGGKDALNDDCVYVWVAQWVQCDESAEISAFYIIQMAAETLRRRSHAFLYLFAFSVLSEKLKISKFICFH
jgi:hypothetical protein